MWFQRSRAMALVCHVDASWCMLTPRGACAAAAFDPELLVMLGGVGGAGSESMHGTACAPCGGNVRE